MSTRRGAPAGGGPGPDLTGDTERRASLVELRERYIEAREEGSAGSPHANLDWILGARRNLTNDPLRLEPSTIRLVALWLQDLASDLERGAGQTRELLVGRLRDATKRFLAASGNSA